MPHKTWISWIWQLSCGYADSQEWDQSNPSNYRPISLLPQISKVFEKIIYDRITAHLVNIDFNFKQQFGFQKNNNTEAALISLVSLAINSITQNKSVGIIFLDYSKAFDSISQNIFCPKLISKFDFSCEDACFIVDVWSKIIIN